MFSMIMEKNYAVITLASIKVAMLILAYGMAWCGDKLLFGGSL